MKEAFFVRGLFLKSHSSHCKKGGATVYLNTALMLLAAICLLNSSASYPLAAPVERTDKTWGPAEDGVQLSLSLVDPKTSELEVALRNVSDRDVMVNLGALMANGKVHLPNNISIKVTDANGNTRQFEFADKKHLNVGGRLDDYIVPLRAGSMYTLTLKLDQFWSQETSEFAIELLPGKNRLTAQLEGSGANFVNLDMPGVRLMNFWLGKVESNTLIVERER